MDYQIFAVLAPLSAIVLISTGLPIIRYRRLRISRAIIFYLGAVSLLLIFNTLELVSPSPQWTLRFAILLHTAWHGVVMSWVIFAAVYAGRGGVAAPRTILLLLIVPILEMAVLLVERWRAHFWESTVFQPLAGFLTLQVEYGPLFWINGAYTYLLLLTGVILIVRAALDGPAWFRRQTQFLVLGAVVPVIFNLVYVFKFLPWLRKDYTAVAFAFSGLAFYFGVQHYRLLGKRPLSRSLVLQDIQSAVMVVDGNFTLLDTNPAAERLLGIDLPGERLMLERDASVLALPLARELLEGTSLTQHAKYETSLEDREGEIRTFDVTIRPVFERTGIHPGTVITITETTEWIRLKQNTQAIQLRMLEQERLATLGMLSANVAHEIKNPLTVVQSAFRAVLEQAQDGGAGTTTARDAEIFQRAFDRIVAVLQSLTNQARPSDLEEIIPADIHALIRNTLQLTHSAYRGVAVVREYFSEVPVVACMPGAISQVLLNIMLNAVQALEGDTNRARREGLIEIHTAFESGAVVCRILNDGPPIPEELQSLIFEPFFSTKAPGQGTGLGLSISREIVEVRHGGTLRVVTIGGLTGFEIRLPPAV